MEEFEYSKLEEISKLHKAKDSAEAELKEFTNELNMKLT